MRQKRQFEKVPDELQALREQQDEPNAKRSDGFPQNRKNNAYSEGKKDVHSRGGVRSKNTRSSRSSGSPSSKTDKVIHEGNRRKITELTTQLNAKAKQLRDTELSHNARVLVQSKLLSQRSKTIKALEAKPAEAQQNKRELQTMGKALVEEGSELVSSSPSFKSCERRFAPAGAGAHLEKWALRNHDSGRRRDGAKDYRFEPHETNVDVWLEISQFVQSFVDGRQLHDLLLRADGYREDVHDEQFLLARDRWE
ncbi:hypothetical protein F4801DRAFT_597369 [Xylaria longipes]|nr:hypothetical protein F4801DRAFT_597369 [Xylaria longipes]